MHVSLVRAWCPDKEPRHEASVIKKRYRRECSRVGLQEKNMARLRDVRERVHRKVASS